MSKNECAWFLLTCTAPALRDPETALDLATRAVAQVGPASPSYSAYLDTLALAYFKTGDVSEAYRNQKIALNAVIDDEPLRAELAERLAQYESALAAGE